MRLAPTLFLYSISFRARRRRYLWMAAGMALGMLALGGAVVFGLGIRRTLADYRKTLFPDCRVLLRPKALSVIWLKVETASITTATLEAVRAVPGVRRVSPEEAVRFPVCVEASILGSGFTTDIAVTGVEGWVLGTDEPPNFTYDLAKGGDLPVVFPSYFLDLYNTALAESGGLPKLSTAAALGRRGRILLGTSTVRPADPATAAASNQKLAYVNGRVVALSRNPDLLGLVVPLKAVEQFNAWYGIHDRKYRALHVELSDPAALDTLREKASMFGLEIVDSAATWKRVMVFVQLIGWAFVAFGTLVFVLAAAYLTSSFSAVLAQRRQECGLFQALGATAGEVATLLAGEIALVGGVGVLAGLGISAALAAWANHWYAGWRVEHTYLPERLFTVPWGWIVLLGAACWTLAIVFSCRRVFRETRGPVAKTLGQGD
jgi:hypothetical protein